MSVKKAAKIYNVPITTLRNRVLGKVDHASALIRKHPMITHDEELKLVHHIKTMAGYGYGYTRQECVNLASDFAVQLSKRGNISLMKWLRGFLKRWPELKVLQPKGLENARAKMASQSIVSSYFANLKSSIQQHDLLNKPHLSFHLDEKGLTTEHKPPTLVASSHDCPLAVTSGKGPTVTLIGCGSASGTAIPPFFSFPGKRMNGSFLAGKSPGAAATMNDSGWSNHAIFRQYLVEHFVKYAPGKDNEKCLIVLDGHKSHVSVGWTGWARDHKIILFI